MCLLLYLNSTRQDAGWLDKILDLQLGRYNIDKIALRCGNGLAVSNEH